MVLKMVFPERDFAEVSVTIMMMVCRQLSFCGCGCAKPTIKRGYTAHLLIYGWKLESCKRRMFYYWLLLEELLYREYCATSKDNRRAINIIFWHECASRQQLFNRDGFAIASSQRWVLNFAPFKHTILTNVWKEKSMLCNWALDC